LISEFNFLRLVTANYKINNRDRRLEVPTLNRIAERVLFILNCSLLLFLPDAENTRHDGMPKAENGHVGDAKHASM
jgi:hypothetical protein